MSVLQTEEGLLEYFEAILSGADGAGRDAESVAVLLRMDVKALLNERRVSFADWWVSVTQLLLLLSPSRQSDW